jgi:hypothetical protein
MRFIAQMSGPANQPLELFGTKLIGVTPGNGGKLLLTACFILSTIIFQWLNLRFASSPRPMECAI